MIPVDKMMRTLSFYRYAEYNYGTMDNSTKSLVQAVVDGINDAAAMMTVRPIEFWVIGAHWENITVQHIGGITRLIGLAMGLDTVYELMNNYFDQLDLDPELRELLMPYRNKDYIFNAVAINDEELKKMGNYE